MDLGIAPTAKLTVVYAVVLYMVKKQSNVNKNIKVSLNENCEMWVHNDCSFITILQFESVQNTNCIWIVLNVFFNFSDSFFTNQFNLENQNRFDPLTPDCGKSRDKIDSFISTSELITKSCPYSVNRKD